MMEIDEILKETRTRLKAYLKYKKVTAKDFAAGLGKGKAFVSGMVGSIATDTAYQIMVDYPDLNMMWLLFGVGEMLNGTNDGPSVAEERPNDEPTRNQKIDMDFAEESIRNLTAALMEQNKIISTLVSKI